VPSELVSAVLDAQPRLGDVRLVAIDGPSGSGKSVLADRLVAALPTTTALVRTDDFATWDDPVSWWPRLRHGVLEPIKAGQPGRYRRTEWVDGTPRPGQTITVEVPEVLIIEGVSAARRSVRPMISVLVWCELADPARRLRRAVARDGEQAREHLLRWQRFESGWFAVDDPRTTATIRQTEESPLPPVLMVLRSGHNGSGLAGS
jgi:uridine kinase